MRVSLLVLIPGLLAAQALEISPSTTARGKTGSFLIRLNASSSQAPASLQWDLVVPKQIAVDVRDVVPGSSAASAEKSIVCIMSAQTRDDTTYRCLLAGGAQTILNGAVAVVRYVVPANASPGTASLRIEKAVGASKDTATIDFPKVQGQITIR
jgi:hypothetical protein